MNLVELAADADEQSQAPCKYGNIVAGHACYCHHTRGPRKCPVWRNGWDWKRGSFDKETGCPYFAKAQA